MNIVEASLAVLALSAVPFYMFHRDSKWTPGPLPPGWERSPIDQTAWFRPDDRGCFVTINWQRLQATFRRGDDVRTFKTWDDLEAKRKGQS